MEPVYDTDEDLKELIKRQGVQIEGLQREVRSMHNAQRRRFWYRLLWWVVVTGVGAWVYYTFMWPYVEQIMHVYGTTQDFQLQIQNFFAQFGRQQ